MPGKWSVAESAAADTAAADSAAAVAVEPSRQEGKQVVTVVGWFTLGRPGNSEHCFHSGCFKLIENSR